ncbi:MAG TPA: sigma-70 family RNA polymerase sigma factor [Terriglobales bacterium]|nr:sigma-70 family RNA polymerase sigma factor [Terriglobales bacterium]
MAILERALTTAGLARVAQGIAPEEFDAIVRQHQQRIYRILLALLRDPDEADTLTQECFLRAYRKRGSFRGEAAVGTWLVRIALNLAHEQRRSPRVAFWRRLFHRDREELHRVERAVAAHEPSPEQQASARQEAAAVWQVVATLSPRQRAIFVLRYAEEMTLNEIAQAMDLEVGTVKVHLSRALAAVRLRLGERRQT